jgi:hypothetical protein
MNIYENDREGLLKQAVEHWGQGAQVDMMIEEMSELTKALCKTRRAHSAEAMAKAVANVLEEMADVQIVLDQMKLIFGSPAEIETRKLERLAERLGKGGGTNGQEETETTRSA